jgi:predicted anti-sigma-YlaC factor YlaD
MKRKGVLIFIVLPVLFILSGGCSITKMATKKVADMLSAPGSSTVFTGDNDPELVGDALPFAIKMYESLMVSVPGHEGLKLRTGSLYVMYANAFIQTPASMLSEEEYKKQEFMYRRAKNLYLRGRDILLEGLEHKHPGFREALDEKRYEAALADMKKEDASLLYWAAAGWLGAFAIDPFDMKLGITLPRAKALMDKVLKLDPAFNQGALHDFYVLYYGSMPEYMGGDFNKARQHFKLAVEASGEKATSPYLSLATTVCVKEQDLAQFKQLLKKVLKIDPDSDPGNRLLHTINRRKACHLLKHVGDYFIEADADQSYDDTNCHEEEGFK